MTTPETTTQFDCFISYSRRDAAFTDLLHRALARYTPPKDLGNFHGRLNVFRDSSDIQGTEYHQAIESHLKDSRALIVVCSPDAATSTYVNDEIERFVRIHGAGRIIPVLVRGLPNNEALEDKERAFPPALTSALTMPLAVDYRSFDVRSSRVDGDAYRTQWMMLLANLLGVSRAEIEQRESKRRRAVRRNWSTAITTIVAALAGLALWAVIEGERALARQLAAQAAIPGSMLASDVEQRVLIAREAMLRERRLDDHSLSVDSALRDALTVLPRKRLTLPAPINALAFTADGKYLVVARAKELVVYSLNTAQTVHRKVLESSLTTLHLSNDLKYVAALDTAGRFKRWHWPTLEEIIAAPPSEVTMAPLACIDILASGKAMIALRADPQDQRRFELMHWLVEADRLLERTEFATTEPALPIAGNQCRLLRRDHNAADAEAALPQDANAEFIAWHWPLRDVSFLAASKITPPDIAPQEVRQWSNVRLFARGANAAVVVHSDGLVIRYPYSTDAREETKEISVANATSLSANGLWLATTTSFEDPVVPQLHPTRIDLIDTATGVATRSIAAHAGRGAFTPDASAYVTFSGHRISKWDRRHGLEQQRITAGFPVENITFDPSSRYLVAYSKDGSAELYDMGAADEVLRSAADIRISALHSPAEPLTSSPTQWARPFDALPEATVEVANVGYYVNSVEVSPQGRFFVLGVATEEPLIKIGQPADLELLLFENTSPPTLRYRGGWGVFRFSADAAALLVDGDDGVARMVETSSGKVLWTYPTKPRETWDGSRPVALSDEGRTVALTNSTGIAVLSGANGQILFESTTPVSALALSANGEILARNDGDGSIVVQRVNNAQTIAKLNAAEVGNLRALMFSPNGNLLLAIGGTRFGTFFSSHYAEEHGVLWDVASGQRLSYVPTSWQPLADYEDQIGAAGDEALLLTSMVWNHHSREFGGLLFSSLLNYWAVPADLVGSTIIVWRLTDEGVEETYRGTSSELLTPIALSSLGGSVIVKDNDSGYRRLIRFEREHLLRVSCQALPKAMTAIEQNRWLPGLRTPMACP